MQVRVKLLGSLRSPQIPDVFTIELPAKAKMISLIDKLSKLHPKVASSLVDESIKSLIMLDGVEVGNLSGLNTPLKEGSEVVMVPITHGG